MFELRPYQQAGVDEFNEARLIYRGNLMVAPTGSGKGVIIGAIVKQYDELRKPVLVVAHTHEIIDQTCAKLGGVPHGVIMAGRQGRELERVQVATIQTLTARTKRNRLILPEAGLLIVDEAHHCPANSYTQLIEAYPNATLLGLTATPCRGDGRGLGKIFQRMIRLPQIQELVDQGHLVKTTVYAPVDPDLKGVGTVAGDFNQGQLAARMNQAKLVGDIVGSWHKYGQRRKTVAFAVNIAHSIHLRDKFIESGVRAEHIDGSTPKPEREETLRRLAAGDIEVLCNCMVLTEGWDCPAVSCIILARPTKQIGMYLQMGGRGLRSFPGKTDCIILDHSGATYRLGRLEDPIDWTLDDKERARNLAQESRLQFASKKLLDCSACGAIREGGKPCFRCGFLPVRSAREVAVMDGELGLLGRNGKAQVKQADPAEWLAMLNHYRDERDHKHAWVRLTFQAKFGYPPDSVPRLAPKQPTFEVVNYIKSRKIAYAKAMAKAGHVR